MALTTECSTMSDQDMGFSPIQTKMMEILKDGYWHRPEELMCCLNEPDAPQSNLSAHLVPIRKLLKFRAQTIVTMKEGRRITHYRLVRMLANGPDVEL